MSTSAQEHVGKAIGRFAVLKNVFIVNDLPKTRSGKIMRRILRKILEGETDQFGDTSTVSPQNSQGNEVSVANEQTAADPS